MKQNALAISPRLGARIAGFLYVLVILLGGFAEVGVRQAIVVAGACYLINSYARFLAPAPSVFPYIQYPCLVGEGALALWPLIVGINETKWLAAVAAEAR